MNSNFTKIVRILLGLILIVFGANKIYSFIPLPAPPPQAADFIHSLTETGYVLTVVAIFEIIIGLMLILKLWVPFALLVLVLESARDSKREVCAIVDFRCSGRGGGW